MELSDKSLQLDHLKSELCEKSTELNNVKLEKCQVEEQLTTNCQLAKSLEEQLQMSMVLLNEQKVAVAAANEENLRLEKVACEYKEKMEVLTGENRELEKSLNVIDARHKDVVQQLMASRDEVAANSRDLSLCHTTQHEVLDGNIIDRCDAEPAEASSHSSSLLLKTAEASASDAANLEEKLERDPVLSCAKTEQSSGTSEQLKACRAELQTLQLIMTEREKSYNDRIAQLSAEVESCLSVKDVKCNDCSTKDCLIDDFTVKTQSLVDERQQLVKDLESCRGAFEDEKRTYKEEISHLHQQIEELTTKLQDADEQFAAYRYRVADSQTDEVIAKLKAEIESLKGSLDEKESVCQLYESEVERLTAIEDRLTKEIERQQEVVSELPQAAASGQSAGITEEIAGLKDELSSRQHELKQIVGENSQLQQKVKEMSAQIIQLQQKLSESAAAKHKASSRSNIEVDNRNQTSVVDSCREHSNGEPHNGDTSHQSISHLPTDSNSEIVQLRSTISQQKDMLDALNSKYTSVRGLLEDRSQAQYGSSVLSDVHQLELELRNIRTDRERLITVLGEKTREASALRAEVHRLTSVAAATQAALMKAQHDAQQIAAQSQQEINQDMKNEAVKKLSQIIKDKDMEIGALQLKNATLVQV